MMCCMKGPYYSRVYNAGQMCPHLNLKPIEAEGGSNENPLGTAVVQYTVYNRLL